MATELDNPELHQKLQELEHEFQVGAIFVNFKNSLVSCYTIDAVLCVDECTAVAWAI
jgi:hypothetical protein